MCSICFTTLFDSAVCVSESNTFCRFWLINRFIFFFLSFEHLNEPGNMHRMVTDWWNNDIHSFQFDYHRWLCSIEQWTIFIRKSSRHARTTLQSGRCCRSTLHALICTSVIIIVRCITVNQVRYIVATSLFHNSTKRVIHSVHALGLWLLCAPAQARDAIEQSNSD